MELYLEAARLRGEPSSTLSLKVVSGDPSASRGQAFSSFAKPQSPIFILDSLPCLHFSGRERILNHKETRTAVNYTFP
jgi:hypothetical protein